MAFVPFQKKGASPASPAKPAVAAKSASGRKSSRKPAGRKMGRRC